MHPADQMLAHSLLHHGRADLALSQYFAISLQQQRLLGDIIDAQGHRTTDLTLLDFACGYGRLLRLSSSLARAHYMGQ